MPPTNRGPPTIPFIFYFSLMPVNIIFRTATDSCEDLVDSCPNNLDNLFAFFKLKQIETRLRTSMTQRKLYSQSSYHEHWVRHSAWDRLLLPLSVTLRIGKYHDIFENITISKISKYHYFYIFDIFQKMKMLNNLYNNGCNTLMQYLMTISYQSFVSYAKFLGELYYVTFALWHEPSVCVCRLWRCYALPRGLKFSAIFLHHLIA